MEKSAIHKTKVDASSIDLLGKAGSCELSMAKNTQKHLLRIDRVDRGQKVG